MRAVLTLSIFLVGCVSSSRQVEGVSFADSLRIEHQKLLDTINRAGVPDSHFEYSVDRNAPSHSYKLTEIARFSEIYLDAKQGRLKAIGRVGFFYYNGVPPIQKNYQEAIKWFTLGAERDDPDCQVSLGECYAFGLGVARDENRAKALFARAALQGKRSFRVSFDKLPPLYGAMEGANGVIVPFSQGNIQGASEPNSFEVTFEADPNGKASWQIWIKEFSGKVVITDSRAVYLQVITAKAKMILTLNELDLHTLYGKGSDQEQYNKFNEILQEAHVAQAELRRLVNLYGK